MNPGTRASGALSVHRDLVREADERLDVRHRAEGWSRLGYRGRRHDGGSLRYRCRGAPSGEHRPDAGDDGRLPRERPRDGPAMAVPVTGVPATRVRHNSMVT